MLAAALKATSAEAGAIWSVVGSNYRLEKEHGLGRLEVNTDRALRELHETSLATACQNLSPASDANTGHEYNGHRYRFLACRDHERPFLVIELVHRSPSPKDSEHVWRALSTISSVASDYRKTQLLSELQQSDSLWNDLREVLPRLHDGQTLEDTAYRIANEGRFFLSCDRVAVARYNSRGAGSQTSGNRGADSRAQDGSAQDNHGSNSGAVGNQACRILTVSGVSDFEPRARQLRELTDLATAVARTGKPLVYPSNEEELPERDRLLQSYLDTSGCESIQLIPLKRQAADEELGAARHRETLGVLIVENFTTIPQADRSRRLELFLQHATIAFQKACDFDSLPLLRLSLRLRKFARSWGANRTRFVAALISVAFLSLLAVIIPAELKIDAKGTFQPQNLRHLYAPMNSEVIQVLATHLQPVEADHPLLILRSRELELKREELLTQRGVSIEKLRGVEAARLRDRKTSTTETLSSAELSASERELREVLTSQDEQLEILKGMLSSLEIKSPIAGSIVSWDPAESLEGRPVQQGQKLMSVAELNSSGELHLRVLDTDIRHVVQARGDDSRPLMVSFTIASHPGEDHTATVTQIGTLSEALGNEGASVRVVASVGADQIRGARPGATVYAKVHCGRSSIGYVWTRRLWDFLLVRLL